MKILIADDHPLYREALRAQIERALPSAEVIEADSLDEAVRIISGAAGPYQLVLLDYHMPGMSADALRQLTQSMRDVPIAVVSGTADNADVRAVIRAGARGFVHKTSSGNQLQHALQLLLAGGTSVPADTLLGEGEGRGAPPKLASDTPAWAGTLTAREADVLRGVTRGLSNKEIARELSLAEVTVKLHLRGIFRKIGAHSRAEAAVIATKAKFA